MQLRQPTIVFGAGYVQAFNGREQVGVLTFTETPSRTADQWACAVDEAVAPKQFKRVEAALFGAVTDELGLELADEAKAS